MRLRLELTTEICEKVEEFKWENDAKLIQMGKWRKIDSKCSLLFFFSKNHYLNKKRMLFLFFIIKVEIPANFHEVMIKNDFGYISESGKFRLENSLKMYFSN